MGAAFRTDLQTLTATHTESNRVDAVNPSLPGSDGPGIVRSQRPPSRHAIPTEATCENEEIISHPVFNSEADATTLCTNTAEKDSPRFPRADVHLELYSNHHIPVNKQKHTAEWLELPESRESQGGNSMYDILSRPTVIPAADYMITAADHAVDPDDFNTQSKETVKSSTSEPVQRNDYSTLYELK